MIRKIQQVAILFAVCFLGFGCSGDDNGDSSIHTICSCAQNVGNQRIEYIYAIYGTDCCESKPDKKTPALHLVWSNATGGWAQESMDRITSKKAQKAGCDLKDSVIKQGDFERMKAALRLNMEE